MNLIWQYLSNIFLYNASQLNETCIVKIGKYSSEETFRFIVARNLEHPSRIGNIYFFSAVFPSRFVQDIE